MTNVSSDAQTVLSERAPEDVTASHTADAERGRQHDPHDPHEPPSGPSVYRTEGALQALTDQIAALAKRIQAAEERHESVITNLGQLRTEDRLLTDMHDQCRALQEHFHEREVLMPIFRTLIGVADRCRSGAAKMRATLEAQSGLELDVVLAVRHVIEAREADRIELEALLATFGVEPYRHEGDRFTASLQKCVRRVPTSRQEQHETIAARALPGYRRHGTVIRPECVEVYVHAR